MKLRHNKAVQGYTRVLKASDLKKLGVENTSQLKWEPGNNHTVEVDDSVGQVLLEKLPREFTQVQEEDTPNETPEPETVDTAVVPEGSATPDNEQLVLEGEGAVKPKKKK